MLEHASMRSQVEATKGALWDAFAEVAVYMEVLRVRVGTAAPASAKGARLLLPLPDLQEHDLAPARCKSCAAAA